jgi:hypothetical protein
VREQTFRAFAVSKSILSWKDPAPARFDEILAARHAATLQHEASLLRSAAMITSTPSDRNRIAPDPKLSVSDLGEKLEQAVHMPLNEVAGTKLCRMVPRIPPLAAPVRVRRGDS